MTCHGAESHLAVPGRLRLEVELAVSVSRPILSVIFFAWQFLIQKVAYNDGVRIVFGIASSYTLSSASVVFHEIGPCHRETHLIHYPYPLSWRCELSSNAE